MLALLGIGVNLYEDAGGVPGALIADDTVTVGDTFFVELTAEDLRETPQGVNGLSLDLAWDAAALEVISDPFTPADFASPLVTPAFSGFRGGTLDEANDHAMIDDLRGLGPSQSGIGDNGPQRYSLIHFRADGVSSAPLEIAIGDIGAGLVNYLRNLLGDDFQIEQPVVTVTDGAPDPDPDPIPQISIGDATVTEGDAGTTQVTLTVSLSEAGVNPVSVRVATRDDQATTGDADYLGFAHQLLTFQPGGSLTQSIQIEVRGDEQVEPDERFFVELSDPTGGTLGDAIGRVVILNDDAPAPVPEVTYSLELTDEAGVELPTDLEGRYLVTAGETLRARVYVTDHRDAAGAGVSAAFADLETNSPYLHWDARSLAVADGFANARSGSVVPARRLVDEAGGTAGTDPTEGGIRHLVFEVAGQLASAAPANAVYTVSLNAADSAEHETFVFGFGDPARASYETAQVMVLSDGGEDEETSRTWRNAADPLDVNADGLRTPQDVLLIINELNANGPHLLTGVGPEAGQWQLDVNGDGGVSRLDALLIFNYLTFGTLPAETSAPVQADTAGIAADPAGTVATADAPLTVDQAAPLLTAAAARWADAGLDEQRLARLDQVVLAVGDLAPGVLGQAAGLRVTLDLDADGTGWFVDPTPDDDREFEIMAVSEAGSGFSLRSHEAASPAGRFDLLTVLSHELGHVLGLDHEAGFEGAEHLMSASLEAGQRRPPTAEAVDRFFSP